MVGVGELKERYKVLPAWGRLLVAFVIGLVPGAYVYLDESDDLDAKLTTLQTQYEESKQKFDAASQKRANLPKLEEQLQFTEEQLAKAKLKLPDNYRIEDILQRVATIAKSAGVSLVTFDPAQEAKRSQPYPYVELTIVSEIKGSFAQIAMFFDQLIHLEGTIFLRRLDLSRFDARDDKVANSEVAQGAAAADKKKTPFQLAQAERSNMRVRARFDVVVYRSMTSQESASAPPPAAAAPAKAPKAPKAPDGAEGGAAKPDVSWQPGVKAPSTKAL